jgi:hypothetical protein
MLSATAYELKLKAACGHPQFAKVKYKSQAQLREQKAEFETMICDECRAQIKAWLEADHGKELFAMDLPDLTGTPKRVEWALDLRRRRYERFGPLMLTLSRNFDTQLAKVTWKALYLMLMVTDSMYWITNRDLPFNHLNLAFEVSHLMKDPGNERGSTMGSSPYGYFKAKAPVVLTRIALFDPNVLAELEMDVMPTIYSGF